MSLRVINIVAIIASTLVVLGFVTGAVSVANSFFFALSIVTLYTGYQLSLRDGMPIGSVLASILTRSSAYPRRAAYLSYVGCMIVGGFVLAQATIIGI
jgi:hypothetical protein